MALWLIRIAISLFAISTAAMAADQFDGATSAEMQKNLAEAYNPGDVDTMAASFTEKAVKVTPSSIFRGREAIRRSFGRTGNPLRDADYLSGAGVYRKRWFD